MTMMSDQAIVFVKSDDYSEVYACGFCGEHMRVPHGADLPECACVSAQLMKNEITGFEFGENVTEPA